jgi:D-aminoacyl-tRNA deacylase
MRAVIQRVKSAKVSVKDQDVSSIGPGMLTLLGIAKGDTEQTLEKLITKINDLRIFEDENGKMNKSLRDIQGSQLIVSNFTLLGDCLQGRRPSFTGAELPDRARDLYERAIELSRNQGIPTFGGSFQAHMEVSLVNDGPVTLIIDIGEEKS